MYENFFWLNEPESRISGDRIEILTSPGTDFWQRTHYGFQRDNGHCFLTGISEDFSLSVRTVYHPQKQYDQCGLIVRIDNENWLKTSTEFETPNHSRLGSVVTNTGWSDWATIDLEGSPKEMHYRIQSRGRDFLIEYSPDGTVWKQLRIAHLHKTDGKILAGIYACSPMDSRFPAEFDRLCLEGSRW